MFLPVDLVSITLIITAIHLLLGSVLTVLWARSARGSGFGWWAGTEWLLALGMGIFILSRVLPDDTVLIVGSLCFLAAMPMVETGLRRWFGHPRGLALSLRWAVMAVGYLIWLSAFIQGAGITVRGVIYSGVLVMQGMLLLTYLHGLRLPDVLPARRILVLSVTVVVLFALLRITLALPALDAPAQVGQAGIVGLLVAEVAAAVMRAGALWMLLQGRLWHGTPPGQPGRGPRNASDQAST